MKWDPNDKTGSPIIDKNEKIKSIPPMLYIICAGTFLVLYPLNP